MTAPESIEAVAVAVLSEHSHCQTEGVVQKSANGSYREVYPCGITVPAARGLVESHRAHVAQALATALAAREQDALGAAEDESRLMRHDNTDLARQLSEASARRADAWDEGYDKAMSDAHVAVGRWGYVARLSDDNDNPYRSERADAVGGEA